VWCRTSAAVGFPAICRHPPAASPRGGSRLGRCHVRRQRSLAAGSAFSYLLGAGLCGTVLMVPIFAQRVLQFTATQTGLLMLPSAQAPANTACISH
jgi:hypothetical protein